MGREQYKTPDEDVAAEFNRVCQLFQLALGKPSDRVLFDSLMSEANARGMNWIQGLEFVIDHRHDEPGVAPSDAVKFGMGVAVEEPRSELRRTG